MATHTYPVWVELRDLVIGADAVHQIPRCEKRKRQKHQPANEEVSPPLIFLSRLLRKLFRLLFLKSGARRILKFCTKTTIVQRKEKGVQPIFPQKKTQKW